MLIETFLQDLDLHWKPVGQGKLRLGLIGSAALMLQADYERGTKDSDVLETDHITAPVKERLLALGGKGSDLSLRHRVYLDVVARGLPFLPQTPAFHPVPKLSGLKHFEVVVLDIVDVIVSKLKRFNANDDADARAMAALGRIDPKKLTARFESAVDRFSVDSRAEDLPRIIRNLNLIERDYLGVHQSKIDLPDWLDS